MRVRWIQILLLALLLGAATPPKPAKPAARPAAARPVAGKPGTARPAAAAAAAKPSSAKSAAAAAAKPAAGAASAKAPEHAPATASKHPAHAAHPHKKLSRMERLQRLETAKSDKRIRPRHGLMALLGLALLGLFYKYSRDRRKAAALEVTPVGTTRAYQPRAVILRAGGSDPHVYGSDDDPTIVGVPGTAPLGNEGFAVPASVAAEAARQGAAPPHEATALVPPADGWGGGDLGMDVEDKASPILTNWSGAGHAAPSAPTSSPAPAAKLDIDDRAAAAAEIDRLVEKGDPARGGSAPTPPQGKQAGAKLQLAEVNDPQPERPRSFPPELGPHFAPLPGETVVWYAPFRVPLVSSGTVALTNQRLLAVYERHRIGLLPPRWHTQTRRHQCPLGAISAHESVGTKRPSLLVVAALLFLWYPAGTLLACLALGLYFGLPRAELAVWSGGVRRLYPLAQPDQEAARRTLDRLLASSAAPGKEAA